MFRNRVTKTIRLATLLLFLLLFPPLLFSQAPQRVRVGLPTFSIPFVALPVGQAKGFFRDEGLEVELIRMRTPVAMIALTNKEIDYAVATGSLLVSAVKGLPLKIVMYWLRAPLHVLNAKPEIRSIQELGGKTIGIAGVTETTGVLLQAILASVKMDREKDVKILLIPDSGNRFATLSQGLMEGAILPPPFNLQAEAKGFRRLKAAAELPEIIDGTFPLPPPTGLGLNVEKLQSNPRQVKQMIRAILKSQAFIRQNKAETIKIMSSWLKIDGSTASGSYDLYVDAMSLDGLVGAGVVESAVEETRQESKIKEKVPAAKVADFSLVMEALAELGVTRSSR
jgi:NitT/TauT family transport system substrate-binding protein